MKTLIENLVQSLSNPFEFLYVKEKEGNIDIDNATGDVCECIEFASGQMPIINNNRRALYIVFIRFLTPAVCIEADADENRTAYESMMTQTEAFANLLDESNDIGVISIDGWNTIGENKNDALYIGYELVCELYKKKVSYC
jgi:hypothetical protein